MPLKTLSPRVVLAGMLYAAAAVFSYVSRPGSGLLTRLRRPPPNGLVGPQAGPQFDRNASQFDRWDGQFSGRRPPPHVLSPHETTKRSVDGAKVSIEYGRP